MDGTCEDRWINLPGVRNMRDLGGLPLEGGGRTAWRRLIRSDNLRALPASAVAELLETYAVRAVADLRTDVEVASEGRGPFVNVDNVTVHSLSLFPPTPPSTRAGIDEPPRLPWNRGDGSARPVVDVYLGYLQDRSDSVMSALRLIATSSGSTIVHCAAGKDRTGMVCAWALAEVGVTREAIIGDYVMSAGRISMVLSDMRSRPTYDDDFADDLPDSAYLPQANTMDDVLAAVDREFGGIPAWLRAHGWTEADATALRAKLVGPAQ